MSALQFNVAEIHGLPGPVPAKYADFLESAGSVDVNGALGKVVYQSEEEGKYAVATFDGLLVNIAAQNLREYMIPRPEDGGFDFAMPADPEAFFDFCLQVAGLLSTQNYCLLQMSKSEATREKAVTKAQRLDYMTPRQEFLADYLGRKGTGKVSEIDPLDTSSVAAISDRLEEGMPGDALMQYSTDIWNLFAGVGPMTADTMGFRSYGLTDTMVWMPYSGAREKSMMQPEELSEEDIEDGKVGRHLHFLKRRKLCFMYFVDNAGGTISLHPREDVSMEPVKMPLSKGKMLVFRSDLMRFSLDTDGDHMTLQAWALADPPSIEVDAINGDPRLKDEFFGLVTGPPAPYHQSPRVLGMSCWTGGAVTSESSAMQMYCAGVDGGVRVPFTRFDTDLYFAKNGQDDHVPNQNSYQTHGGLCADEVVMTFDNKFFGISDDEASVIVPNQRKVLEVGYECLAGAGVTKEKCKNAPISVFVGDCGTEWAYQLLVRRMNPEELLGKPDVDWYSAQLLTTIGSRLSYTLGLRGPTFHCDTACSAGLTAFCTAMYTIRTAKNQQTIQSHLTGGLAGGVNQILDPAIYIANSAQHMLSVKGRCFTFDVGGDGYGRGEGISMAYAVFSDSNEHIAAQHAVAIGTKVNQDGRSASMTAPNGPAQQMCIKASLKEACVDPHEITTSECHGTGTSLGDPIEVGSLRGVQETDERDNALLCTSSKSNIGHLEADAGVTGLFKCILMNKYSVAPPNCHLRTLNPHLDINGWPAIFENDMCDYSANSGIAGVSSFGVSGTNSHAEIWAQCRVGPNSSNRHVNVDPERLDFVKTTCPITLGPIDYLTGEPVPNRFKITAEGERLKARPDVLRDELADYDISSYAYSGGYRFRREELDEGGEELDAGFSLFISGSWNGFRKMQEMELQEDGSYMVTVVMCETRAESFYLCLNENPAYRIYPACNNADDKIWIHGPDANEEGKRWIIDGRDDEVPAGTCYQIKFWWGWERKRISWEEVSPKHAELAIKSEHSYFVSGTWTTNGLQAMTKDPDDPSVWECNVRIGSSAQEEFCFVRDGDMGQQVIYPAQHKAELTRVPVRGPDELAGDKRWLMRGPVDEIVQLRLEVDDGKVTVTSRSPSAGEKTWESQDGPMRRQFFMSGSWNDWECEPMQMDAETPGVYRYRGTMGQGVTDGFQGFAEYFKIVVDQDYDITFYPEATCAGSGECIVRGPDQQGTDRPWLLKSYRPGVTFEVVLNLKAVDKRKIVTWTFEDTGTLALEGDSTMALPAPNDE
mmetsp:Transcript_7167/g.18356  ORF Transcript_7167/g.18356 Transcript_7167/m.18356 type:complete len:1270 (-) Transcript_7167:430-4239(-)